MDLDPLSAGSSKPSSTTRQSERNSPAMSGWSVPPAPPNSPNAEFVPVPPTPAFDRLPGEVLAMVCGFLEAPVPATTPGTWQGSHFRRRPLRCGLRENRRALANLCLVSRRTRQAAQVLLYRSVVLQTHKQLAIFFITLFERPETRCLVRSLAWVGNLAITPCAWLKTRDQPEEHVDRENPTEDFDGYLTRVLMDECCYHATPINTLAAVLLMTTNLETLVMCQSRVCYDRDGDDSFLYWEDQRVASPWQSADDLTALRVWHPCWWQALLLDDDLEDNIEQSFETNMLMFLARAADPLLVDYLTPDRDFRDDHDDIGLPKYLPLPPGHKLLPKLKSLMIDQGDWDSEIEPNNDLSLTRAKAIALLQRVCKTLKTVHVKDRLIMDQMMNPNEGIKSLTCRTNQCPRIFLRKLGWAHDKLESLRFIASECGTYSELLPPIDISPMSELEQLKSLTYIVDQHMPMNFPAAGILSSPECELRQMINLRHLCISYGGITSESGPDDPDMTLEEFSLRLPSGIETLYLLGYTDFPAGTEPYSGRPPSGRGEVLELISETELDINKADLLAEEVFDFGPDHPPSPVYGTGRNTPEALIEPEPEPVEPVLDWSIEQIELQDLGRFLHSIHERRQRDELPNLRQIKVSMHQFSPRHRDHKLAMSYYRGAEYILNLLGITLLITGPEEAHREFDGWWEDLDESS